MRAVVVAPTKELAAQTAREATRLAVGTGLRVGLLSRAAAAGDGSAGRLSAAQFAADLHRAKGRPAGRGRGGAAAAGGGKDEGDGGEGDSAEGGEEDDEEEEDEEDDDEEEDDDGEDGVAGGEDDMPAGADPDPDTRGPVAVPALPAVDLLVATPLLLVALLRRAAAQAPVTAAAAGADAVVCIPSLRHLVFDEADKLLELGFLEQVGGR